MDSENDGGDGSNEEPCCRICLESAGGGNGPLITPCRCSGTSRFVHRGCLQTWLQVSGSGSCEVCNMPLPILRQPGTWRDGLTLTWRVATGLGWQESVATVGAIIAVVLSLISILTMGDPNTLMQKMVLMCLCIFMSSAVLLTILLWIMFFRNKGERVMAMWRGMRTQGLQTDIELGELET